MNYSWVVSASLLILVGGFGAASQTAAFANPTDAAYAPVLAASQQRIDDAQRRLKELRAQGAELAARQKTLNQQIDAAAQRQGVEKNPQYAALRQEQQRLAAEQKRLAELLKMAKPAEFKSLAEMTRYDQWGDEEKAAKAKLTEIEHQAIALRRSLAAQEPEGAKLVKQWEELEVARIALANETAVAQLTRDAVVRGEGNLVNKLRAQPAAASQEIVEIDVAPPADAAERRTRFAERLTPAGVQALGERFFSQMSLDLRGLEQVQKLVAAKEYGPALEAYKAYYFQKLLAPPAAREKGETLVGNHVPATAPTIVFPPPTKEQIELALAGTVVDTIALPGKAKTLRARLGQPGAIAWVFVDPQSLANDPNGPYRLDLCRRQGYPGLTGAALLHSYAVSGNRDHLARWSEIVDDWTMNWQRDVEQSPLPLRDYHLLYVCRIQETRAKLKMLAQMRPEFVQDLPAATLARMLMAMNEEYLGAAIRLGRSGLYNFRIMALNSMIPTSLEMQEFHAHQWALREGWRQVDNNFIYKTRRDGANFEFANDGHENTDQALYFAYAAMRSAKPDWLDPYWEQEFLENLLNNTRYWVHNLRQDGYSYRLNSRTQRMRYQGDHPEYKVDLLAQDEDEVRRRMWKVHGVGRPSGPPQVLSDGLAFQGYYYLRSGWEPEDYFLYFQSIGQPILSGREDNTGFSLYGHGHALLLTPATTVDGRTQNIHYGLVQNPGGKAHFAAYGQPDVVKKGRFLSNGSFDFVEGEFEGVYQYHRPSDFFAVFGDYGFESSRAKAESQAKRKGEPFSDEPIRDVRQARQILALRGRDTYLVTDYLHSEQPHQFSQKYTIYTPLRTAQMKKRLELLRQENHALFTADTATQTLETHNPGQPNLRIQHFSKLPVAYAVQKDARPDRALAANGDFRSIQKAFSKRDQHHTAQSQSAHFSQRVSVDWKGQGPQVMVTLVTPQGRSYDPAGPLSPVTDIEPLTPRQDVAGFTGKFRDGEKIAYLAAAAPAPLQLEGVQAHASALLITGDEGVALDCTEIRAGGETFIPPHRDFTFRLKKGRVVFDEPIYRPIQPVVIEPAVNVFTDSTQVTLSCATPDVELRYTLDGAKPTPQSPLYEGPITIRNTCRFKARAFRKGVTEDLWQADGTRASVVYSTVFRKETPAPATAVAETKLGLKYDYFEGPWTELLVRSLTMPPLASGEAGLLDVGMRRTDGPFAVRYDGYFEAPADGVYTFYTPDEFVYPDIESGYDLRLFVNNREWYPNIRWHGHGTWSVALKKGRHPLRVVFVDFRFRPHKVELMWNFPDRKFTWDGEAPQLQVSGPLLPKQPLPAKLLSHTP